jgi:regulatory protein YycI of two-component signal transduction system YycFG
LIFNIILVFSILIVSLFLFSSVYISEDKRNEIYQVMEDKMEDDLKNKPVIIKFLCIVIFHIL